MKNSPPDPDDQEEQEQGDTDLGQALLARGVPLTNDLDGWRYLRDARQIDERAIYFASQNLRWIDPPIPGFDPRVGAIISLLHDAKGNVSGLALEAVGPGGERVVDDMGRTFRRSYTLRERGQIEALFRVPPVIAGALICYVSEGRLAKPLAVVAAFDAGDPAAYGWGGLSALGYCPPPELTVVVIEDRAPSDPEKAEKHADAMARGCDRLVLANRMVQRAGPPPCAAECGCKDVDEYLVKHGAAETRAWFAKAVSYTLSLWGEAMRIGRVTNPVRRVEMVNQVIDARELRKQSGMVPAFRRMVESYAGNQEQAANDDKIAASAPVQDTIPWPTPVDGAAVLDEIVAAIKRHVLLTDEAAWAIALWVAFSHGLDLFWFSPRLALCSPVKRCGKTTTVEVLLGLVARPKPTSSTTGPTVFRLIDKYKPTYLIDEADGYLPDDGNSPASPEQRPYADHGLGRHSTETNAVTGERDPKSFSTWTPIVCAGIGKLPSTLDDRSIKIRLQRKPRHVRLTRFRPDRATGIAEIGRRVARFVLDNQIAIGAADIEPPEELHDRAADNWRPLMGLRRGCRRGVARARPESRPGARGINQVSEDMCVELLADIRSIFEEQKDPERQRTLFTSELMTALLSMTDRPWLDCGHNGRAMTERQMSELLKPFGIKTHKNVRRSTQQAKGFRAEEFAEAYARYLPGLGGVPGSRGPNTEIRHVQGVAMGPKRGPTTGPNRTAPVPGPIARRMRPMLGPQLGPMAMPQNSRKRPIGTLGPWDPRRRGPKTRVRLTVLIPAPSPGPGAGTKSKAPMTKVLRRS